MAEVGQDKENQNARDGCQKAGFFNGSVLSKRLASEGEEKLPEL
jgi:hypothetical protein